MLRRSCLAALLLVFFHSLAEIAAGQVAQPESGSTGQKSGAVLFEKSQSSEQQQKSNSSNITQTKKVDEVEASVTDAERSAITFTAYDMDAHLTPVRSHLAMRVRFRVRNDGAVPLTRLVLQISSSLEWERFTTADAAGVVTIPFVQHQLDTDADHTGRATEAILTLPAPLAVAASLELTALYSGEISQSAQRLERIGAPAGEADYADWDTIAPNGTLLRGFGSVLWYPVAAEPVFLGDGAKYFRAVGATKLRQAAATVRLRLAVEYVGDAPSAAFFCGAIEPLLAVSENVNALVADAPGVATVEFAARPLGFRAPSLFVTDRPATKADGEILTAVTDDDAALSRYTADAVKVQPLVMEWLGSMPLRALNILDHAGQPFEDDALLVAPMRDGDPAAVSAVLAHSLAHAWFHSSHVWLDEGVAQFMSLLWVERSQGREAAIQQMQEQANALALVEPEQDGVDVAANARGQSLVDAHDEVYYRTKSAAVLWMLRSVVGDDALKDALQVYRYGGKQEDDANEFQRVLEKASGKDMQWFFEDWVYRDRGLPELTVMNIAPRELPLKGGKSAGWLVAVEVRNDGDAVAEVPVTVRSGALTATERLRIAGKSRASTRIVFEGVPAEVQVNDGSVPEVGASVHIKKLSVQIQ